MKCKYVSTGSEEPSVGVARRVAQLCELASKEMDTEKLFALVAEINRLFQEDEMKNKQTTQKY